MIRLAFLSVVFFTVCVHADPVPAPTPPPPTVHVQVVRTPGKQIEFTTSDGRVAGLYFSRRAPISVPISFSFGESSCPNVPADANPKCEFEVPFRAQILQIKWLKNPDPARVGQVVNLGFPLTDSEIESPIQQLDGTDPELAPLAIRCDDFTWLTGTKDAPATFEMAEWAGERMSMNPETGASENMTVVSQYTPIFAAKSPRELIMTKAGFYDSMFGNDGRLWFFLADVIQMISAPTPGAPSCQTSIKPDMQTARTLLQKYVEDASGAVPYLDSQDNEYDNRVKSGSTLTYAIQDASETEWK